MTRSKSPPHTDSDSSEFVSLAEARRITGRGVNSIKKYMSLGAIEFREAQSHNHVPTRQPRLDSLLAWAVQPDSGEPRRSRDEPVTGQHPGPLAPSDEDAPPVDTARDVGPATSPVTAGDARSPTAPTGPDPEVEGQLENDVLVALLEVTIDGLAAETQRHAETARRLADLLADKAADVQRLKQAFRTYTSRRTPSSVDDLVAQVLRFRDISGANDP